MDGIIVIYKEKGYTSFDVVAKLRGILGQKKIGHTGTLDPDAEGVLPICIGKATKVCELLTEKDKIYDAVLHLGISTDTQDMTGKVIQERSPQVSEEELVEIIHGFVGQQKQVPPMYSALKVNGQKLCDLARKGIEIERKSRDINIFSIENIEIEIPRVTMRVHCSKGTYIRTLCHDIGEAAGCGGCMEHLLRVETAGFSLEEAYRLKEVEDIVRGVHAKEQDAPASRHTCHELKDILIPVDFVLKHYPAVYAEPSADRLLMNGNKVPISAVTPLPEEMEGVCRMYDSAQKFVGIYQYDKLRREFKAMKMFL